MNHKLLIDLIMLIGLFSITVIVSIRVNRSPWAMLLGLTMGDMLYYVLTGSSIYSRLIFALWGWLGS